MKWLRRLISANTVLLAAVGIGIAFHPPLSLPVRYAIGEPFQSLALIHIVAIALAGLALALLLQTGSSFPGELRRLGFGLSLTNGLIALMFFFEQIAFGGDWVGWILMLIALAMAAALAWMARRPLRPAEIAAEIEALKIPDEIRQGLLRQIGEAAAQEERNRLARDLHDSIKQQLFSINVGTAAAQERWERDPEGARKALADVRRSAREAMAEMQAMLHQLRPEALGTAGLIEALREQCEALGYRTGAGVALELGEPVPDDRMPPGAPEALFRMAQEMLANVARHARARQVRLWLGRQDESVVLQVEDDGQGFDPTVATPGMGLRNLKERAESSGGKLEVDSAPGAGTRMAVRILLVPPPGAVEPVDAARVGLWEAVRIIGIMSLLLPLWHVPALRRAVFDNGFHLILFVFVALSSWWLSRRERHLSPHLEDYERLQGRALFSLLFIWWMSAGEPRSNGLSWLILLLALFLAALNLIRLHRASTMRYFWRGGPQIWLWLVLLIATEILLLLGLALFEPKRLVLEPIEVFFLLTAGIGFAYIISRRPRLEGAPS